MAAAEGAEEDLAAELELLSAMYGEDFTASDGSVEVTLRPQSGGEAAQRFVEATLSLQPDVVAGYPSVAAAVSLRRGRGLVEEEERGMLDAMRATAISCAENAEPALFTLVECALEQLTSFNSGGACPVCREALFGPPDDAPDAPARPVFLSHCYHSFHAQCLGAWWHTVRASTCVAVASAETAPTRAAAARAEARAGEAAARELRAKANTCAETADSLAERLAVLNSMIDPPPPAAELRKAQAECAEASGEVSRLEGRASKAESRALTLGQAADAAADAERDAASDAPLPCPVCRAELSVASLREGGVVRAESVVDAAEAQDARRRVELTDAQATAQRERRELWERQQSRQQQEPRQQQQQAAALDVTDAPAAEPAAPAASLPPGLGASRGGGGGRSSGRKGRSRGRGGRGAS